MEWLAVIVVFLVLCALLNAVLPHKPSRVRRWLWSPFHALIRRHRRQIVPEPDPFDTLRLQTRLGHLAGKIRLVEATPHVYAKAHKLMALEAAYDDLLDEACRLAGIPGEADAERGEEKRWHEEQELTSRGWSW